MEVYFVVGNFQKRYSNCGLHVKMCLLGQKPIYNVRAIITKIWTTGCLDMNRFISGSEDQVVSSHKKEAVSLLTEFSEGVSRITWILLDLLSIPDTITASCEACSVFDELWSSVILCLGCETPC